MSKAGANLRRYREKIYSEFKFNPIIYIGIVFAIFSLFYCIRYIVCGSMDDINTYVGFKLGSGIYETSKFAQSQGRVFTYLTAPVTAVPFMFDSWVWYKFTSFFGLLFSAAMLCLLLYRHVSKESALLAVLIFFAFVQLDEQHNVLICYVFSHQIDIGLSLLSVERYLTWIKTKKKSAITVCCIAWLYASMLYECYLLTFGIFVLICIFYNIRNRHFEFKAALRDIFIPFICVVAFAAVYFGYRYFFPSQNVGAVIDEKINIFETLKTMLVLSFGKFPGYTSYLVLRNYSISDLLGKIDFITLLNSILAASAFGFLSYIQKTKMTFKNTFIYLFISFVMICIPNFLHAFTPKYKDWVARGTFSYVSSIPSFYVISGILAIILLFLSQKIKFRKIFIALMSPVVFLLALATGISNNIVAESFIERQNDYQNLERVIMSDYLTNVVEDNSQIYCNNFRQSYIKEIVEAYIKFFTNKDIAFSGTEDELDFNYPVYALKFNSQCDAALIGKIDEYFSAKEICLIHNENKAVSSISLYSNNSELDVKWRNIENTVKFNTDFAYVNIPQHEGNEVYLTGSSIVVNECDIYSEEIAENSTREKVIISMNEGFSGRETNGDIEWNWCGYNGSLTINNCSSEKLFTALTFGYSLGAENGELHINPGDNEIVITDLIGSTIIPVILPRGKTTIKFEYYGDKVNAPNDPRDLCFRLIDIEMVSIAELDFSSLCEGVTYTEQKDPTSFRWNWSDNNSQMFFINFCKDTYSIVIDGEIGIADEKEFFVSQNGKKIHEEKTFNFMPLTLEVNLEPGKNILVFSTTADQVVAEGDPRTMYFRFINPVIYSAK